MNYQEFVYYVYELVDPRDGEVFYVGKGKDNRMSAHVHEAKRGKTGKKCDRIREVLSGDLLIEERIVREFDDEDSAYAFEKKRIAHYGLGNLTNIAPGGRDMPYAEIHKRAEARKLIRSMSRAARIMDKHEEVGIWFCGRWKDIPRSTIATIIRDSVAYAIDVFGKTEAKEEFSKHGVLIENNG